MVFFGSNLMLFGQGLTDIPVNHFLKLYKDKWQAGKFLNFIWNKEQIYLGVLHLESLKLTSRDVNAGICYILKSQILRRSFRTHDTIFSDN